MQEKELKRSSKEQAKFEEDYTQLVTLLSDEQSVNIYGGEWVWKLDSNGQIKVVWISDET